MASLDKIPICANCGKPVSEHEGDPYQRFDMKDYCLDCALKLGMLGPMEWLHYHGFGIYHHAEYHNGRITAYQKWGKGYRKDELEILG